MLILNAWLSLLTSVQHAVAYLYHYMHSFVGAALHHHIILLLATKLVELEKPCESHAVNQPRLSQLEAAWQSST